MNDRGRVPFAFVGIVLLVTSTTLATTVGFGGGPDGQPDVETAMDGATAAATTELREAADGAATAAAITPVVEPAATPAGRALNGSRPFRDALRLRIYLRAEARLDSVERTRGDVTVTASLPAVEPTEAGYREAIDRVGIERAGEDGAALAVSIEGVTLAASRNGRIVSTVERSPTFVVANPALLLHDRTEGFERRATAPVTEAGLGRRLTARLYPIAWTRGYAQYGGAPIANVLGTRHVEFAANDALLAEQRATFGAVDPAGRRGTTAAGLRVAGTDLLAAVGKEEWYDTVFDAAAGTGDPPADRPLGARADPPEDPATTVGVNGSADRAFADVVGIDGDDELGRLIERAHTVDARIETETRLVGYRHSGDRSPGVGWALRGIRVDESVSTRRVGGDAPRAAGWSTESGATFEVTVTETTTRDWAKENETTATTTTERRRYRVGVAAQARAKPIEGVPPGRLDGRLGRATRRAVEDAIADAGGFESAARTAADGGSVAASASATAESRPREVFESDLRSLRERTRSVSVTLPSTAVGTGRSNPPRRLRAELDDRRSELRGPVDRTPEGRIGRAARLAYLGSLDDELGERESAFDGASETIGDAVGDHIGGDRVIDALAAHRTPSGEGASTASDPAGNLTLAVETGPSYLTTAELDRGRFDGRRDGSVYPLSTRTVSVFSSPHGQVASGIVDRIPFLGVERVSLSTAARTLAATPDGEPGRDRLREDVASASAYVRQQLHGELVSAGVGRAEARAALESDAPTATAALELANGTTAERAAAAVEAPVPEDRLAVRLRTRLEAALESEAARPRRGTASEAQLAARERYGDRLEDVIADGVESEIEREKTERLGERLGALPAGLPLAPLPGYWYATVNIWYVDVEGRYERFAVRANRGDGTGPVTYRRDGRAVTLTHRGEERYLGDAARVEVDTRTAVVVVVPPGPRGVGDTDGTPDERSPGWDG